jgi:thiol-disulfide isomerase/thioredoxin
VKRIWSFAALGFAVLGLAAIGSETSVTVAPPPPFTSTKPADWIGRPVTWEGLRGRVVLLDLWRFACDGCIESAPWLHAAGPRWGAKGLSLVGVHSPQFEQEKKRERVEAEVKGFGLDYPQLLDNDLRYFDSLHGQYWPTSYLVDRCGRMRERHIGALLLDNDDTRHFEAHIDALLAEPAAPCPG